MNKIESTLQRLKIDFTGYERIREESFASEVYVVHAKNGSKILKLAHSEVKYWREIKSLSFLSGRILVPNVLASLDPESGLNGVLLLNRLAGRPLSLTTLDFSLANACGQLLAKLHSVPTQGLGYFQKNGFETVPFEDWWSYRRDLVFGSWTRAIEKRIEPGVLKRIHEVFEHYFESFSVSPNCYIHCDFRFGNILANAGAISGLIDFESSRTGDPAYDFIKIHEAIGADSKLWESFLTGYSETRTLPDLKKTIPYYELDLNYGFLQWAVLRGEEKLFQERFDRLLRLIDQH